MKTRTKICMAAWICAASLTAISVGYAAWNTEVTAGGGVSASGSWDLRATAADLRVSSVGASVKGMYTDTVLTQTCDSATAQLAAKQVGSATRNSIGVGKQNRAVIHPKRNVCLVDTSVYDLSDLSAIDPDNTDAVINLGTLKEADLEDYGIPPVYEWYIYANSDAEKVPLADDLVNKVIGELIEQSDAIVRAIRPDSYQNWALVVCDPADSAKQFVIAQMRPGGASANAVIGESGAVVTYGDVAFGMPGAWAEYSLTVTNNGTADAALSDIEIGLVTETPDQLTLAAPDLTDETLAPGESCTITFVVQVPSDVQGVLRASGTVTVRLPYALGEVEPAPAPGHTHG